MHYNLVRFTIVADYADDKVIISFDKFPNSASANLQTHLNLMSEWYTDWRIKPNPKSQYIQNSLYVTPFVLMSINITYLFPHLTQLDI